MANHPIDNARAQEIKRSERNEAEKRRLEKISFDLEAMMKTAEGRRVLYWIMFDLAGLNRTSFTGNSETYFREGARDLGLKLSANIQALCFENFVTMLKEHKQD